MKAAINILVFETWGNVQGDSIAGENQDSLHVGKLEKIKTVKYTFYTIIVAHRRVMKTMARLCAHSASMVLKRPQLNIIITLYTVSHQLQIDLQ